MSFDHQAIGDDIISMVSQKLKNFIRSCFGPHFPYLTLGVLRKNKRANLLDPLGTQNLVEDHRDQHTLGHLQPSWIQLFEIEDVAVSFPKS